MTSTHLESDRESLTHLVTGILHDTEELLTQQVKLFKVEMKNDARRAIGASVPMVAAVLVAFIGAIVLAFGVAHVLLAIWPNLPVWAAYLIVGGLLCLGSGLVIARSIHQLGAIKPLDQTAAGVKENIQWKTNN